MGDQVVWLVERKTTRELVPFLPSSKTKEDAETHIVTMVHPERFVAVEYIRALQPKAAEGE